MLTSSYVSKHVMKLLKNSILFLCSQKIGVERGFLIIIIEYYIVVGGGVIGPCSVVCPIDFRKPDYQWLVVITLWINYITDSNLIFLV